MSMTDEGTRPPNEPASSENPETTSSGQNGAGQPAQGLPGLAGFGQMQGYAPVTEQPQQAETPVEQPVEAVVPTDLHENDFAQEPQVYAQEPQVYAQEPQVQEPQDYAEHVDPAAP